MYISHVDFLFAFCFNILIFIYFFKYKTIETHARAFLPLNISAIGTVIRYKKGLSLSIKLLNGISISDHWVNAAMILPTIIKESFFLAPTFDSPCFCYVLKIQQAGDTKQLMTDSYIFFLRTVVIT